MKGQFTLQDLVKDIKEATIQGDPNCMITGISSLKDSKEGHITFLTNPTYKKFLSSTKASAVILSPETSDLCNTNKIISVNPYFVYAQISSRFGLIKTKEFRIESSAIIQSNVTLGTEVGIGANSVVGENSIIGNKVMIGPGCVIGDNVEIGSNTTIKANATIHDGVKIGNNVHIESGVVVGSEGFGFANDGTKWHKIAQLGSVIVGNDVDIGANTTIDRGAIDNTIIEDGVKLDNLIQVGHNVTIGAHTIIAGCVAIAGSVTLGKHCMIGGGTCFAGHITVCDRAIITGMTAVTKSITQPGIYSSGIVGAVPNKEFRKNNARFHRLGNLIDRVKKLEEESSLGKSKTS